MGHAACARRNGGWCPEESASWLSYLVFGFVSSLIDMGSRKALCQDDLWDLPKAEEANEQCQAFDEALQTTMNSSRSSQVRCCHGMAMLTYSQYCKVDWIPTKSS